MGGRVIWLTGLSGAGKTTLAAALQKELQASILLDGDNMREVLSVLGGRGGYDQASRRNLALTYAGLARMLAVQGFTVIVATISLFHEVHRWNREHMPGYLEVFMDVPLAVRESRDPKGLYAQEKRGALTNLAGKSVEVELPLRPDLVLTEKDSPEDGVRKVLDRLADRA